MSSEATLFADGTNFVCDDKTVITPNLGSDIENIYDWLCANKFSLNASKSVLLSFWTIL